MRKFIFIPILLLIACSQTKEQRAKNVVKRYLDSALNDPHSYEPVEFSNLDSTFTTYEEDANFILANTRKDSIEVQYEIWKKKNPDFDGIGDLSDARVKYFTKMIKYYNDGMIREGKVAIDIMKSYKPKFKGYKIIHRYRAKNGFGALNLEQTGFELDSAVTKVTNVKGN